MVGSKDGAEVGDGDPALEKEEPLLHALEREGMVYISEEELPCWGKCSCFPINRRNLRFLSSWNKVNI